MAVVVCLAVGVGLFLAFGPSLWRTAAPGELAARQNLTERIQIPGTGPVRVPPAEQAVPSERAAPSEPIPPSEPISPSEPMPPPDREISVPETGTQVAGIPELPVRTRERGVFFVRARNGGEELELVKVGRAIRVSLSPLRDSLDALLSGPSAEEAGQEFISLIAPEARLIGVSIRDEVAFIDFSDDFQYNPWGNEGLSYQIRQIVWTATEFPNVRAVQILIEGKIVDFLNGGIRIGNPLSR